MKKRVGVMKRGKALLLAAIVLAMSILPGCSGQKKEEDLKKEVEEFNASIKKTESNTNGNRDIVVGSVNMGMNGEWFAEVMNGIRDAGKDLGVNLKMLDSDSDLELEKQNINSLVQEGIDVLVISPISSDETVKSLQPVKDAGIPIITWNTTVNTDVTAAVGVDATALGADTGDYVVEYIKTYNLKKVNMILLTNTFYDVGIARCDGFRESIQDLVNEGVINIVAEDQAETFDEGVEVTKELLKNHSDVDMIWAWNQGSLLGCIDAVKSEHREDIVVMGTDMSMQLANDMLEDKVSLQAVTTQLPYNMGYKAVVNAVRAARGETVENKVVIPLATYTKDQTSEIKQYIENHKDLVNE